MDLPFLWTPPRGGDARVSASADDSIVLSATRPTYHGLDGNHHLQQPFVYRRVFSPVQCEAIKAIGAAQRIWDGRSTSDDGDYRVCKTSWLEETSETAFIFARLRELVASVNELYQLDASGFAEPLHYICYEAGGHFDWHTDLGSGPMSTRKISISIQLSATADYLGGELEFCPHGVIDEFQGGGNAIAFPSYIAHRVLPVTRGQRHALVAWIHGRAFR
ncbi:MAG: 2OG-Fe(II) oxygenase [Usitatibacter sp.]